MASDREQIGAGTSPAIEETWLPGRCVVQVESARHENGLVWRWREALDHAREHCSLCRPALPCLHHDAPRARLEGGPWLDFRTLSCPCCRQDGEEEQRLTEATFGNASGAWMNLCEPCTAAWAGPEAA